MDFKNMAADELLKAQAANDRRLDALPELEASKLVPAAVLLEIRAEVATRNLELAWGFTALAAIDAEVPVCVCPHAAARFAAAERAAQGEGS